MGERARAAVVAAIGALMGAQAADAATKRPPAKGNGVKDGTLTLRDFKQGVLESKFFTEREVKQLLSKLEGTLSSKFSHLGAASAPVVIEQKIDTSSFAKAADLTAGLGDLSLKIDTFSKLVDVKFFKQGAVDAEQSARVLKLEAAVQRFGDGSVHTGRVADAPEAPVRPVLVVPGTVEATPGRAGETSRLGLELRDLSGADATVVGTRNGDPIGPFTLKAGETSRLGVSSEGPTTFVLQVLSADGGLATLTISSFAGDGSVRTWAGQALAAG